VRFIRDIAERVDRAPIGETIQVQVEYPLRILKAILQCFVSANGKAFVENNIWIRRFLLDSKNRDWDPLAHLYIYATPVHVGRQTGLSGMVNVVSGEYKIMSEFTFWPLGSILTYMPFDHLPLTPIHQWAKVFTYQDRGLKCVSLPVNVIATAFPIDFRSAEQVRKDAEKHAKANGRRENRR
jgi:hypothetical protein